MRHAFAWLVALGLAIPQISTAEGSHTMQDHDAVLSVVKTMTSAFEKNDIARVMESYEPGAAVVFEPSAPVDEAAQLEAMFTAMAALNPTFTYTNGHEVIVAGDLAMHIAPWEMTGQTPDGERVAQSGLSVAVMRRQADGSWRMVIDNPHGAHLLRAQN